MQTCSVAICTYNGSRFIREQLQSVLDQTVLPDEIVVVDDLSSDHTAEIVESYRPAAHALGVRLQVIRNAANLGYIKNFEKAVSLCAGELIFLCDQDDVWVASKIAQLAACFDNDPEVLLVYSDATVVDHHLKPLGYKQSEALDVTERERQLLCAGRGFEALLARNLVTGATVAFRRGLLKYALPFPLSWIHDEWLAIVAATVGSIRFYDQCLIDYRQHPANQIGIRRRALGEKLRSMFRPRGRFYALQVERAEDLKQRLTALPVSIAANKLAALEDRLEHMRFRADLPRSRLARIFPALMEWRSGRYRQYSSGLRGVVRDLFEPT